MNLELFHQLNNLLFSNSIFDAWVYYFAVNLPYCVAISAVVFLSLYPMNVDPKGWLTGFGRRISRTLHALFAVGTTYVLVYIIKHVVAHPRPFEYVQGVKVLFTDGGGDSFPSGHASAFAALATVVYFHHKPAGVLFFIATFLISISRVIGGVHFPIDILVGWIIGVAIALLFNRLWGKFVRLVSIPK